MSSGSSTGKMKRKRKEACPSPILDDSPKRTKVHAQRKFAQNSGVHSPILTPIRDLDISEDARTSSISEPVELLPMKRPNTEDFLTFLCFRGTPILPSNLQFFNTASIVADGQVHEIKGDCPKNGPIDITKCAGSSSEKPFIAFGVRKRADPIVISRQMEKKRRHALAIQALRRKYQEQKMAKIRALTISKLSEKTTNKTLVKTNTIQKTETVTKKSNTMEKTKVIATKHVKVTTQTLKTKVKPRMCLRSFRGKFVQKELPFRPKKPLPEKHSNSPTTIKNTDPPKKPMESKPAKKPAELNAKSRVTRSGSETPSTPQPTSVKRPQIKRRILLPTSAMVNTIVKPKLRSTTVKKTVISRRKAQQRLRTRITRKDPPKKSESPNTSQEDQKPGQELSKRVTRRDTDSQTEPKKEITKNFEVKREVKIAETATKKVVKKNLNLKRDFAIKTQSKEIKKNVAMHKTSDTVLEKTESGQKVTQDVKTMEMTTVRRVLTRKSEETKVNPPTKRNKNGDPKKNKKDSSEDPKSLKKVKEKLEDVVKSEDSKEVGELPRRLTRDYSLKLSSEDSMGKPTGENKVKKKRSSPVQAVKSENIIVSCKVDEVLPPVVVNEVVKVDKEDITEVSKPVTTATPTVQSQELEKSPTKEETLPLEALKKPKRPQPINQKRKPPSDTPITSSRPTRKTKEAAAIYMEILSHKLVNDRTIDDDNISIDSFPELPNVKRTEQREIELKAQAKEIKSSPEEVVIQSEIVCKRKLSPALASSDESDNEVLQIKVQRQSSLINPSEDSEDRVLKRQARIANSKHSDSNSSDESFHVDVRVPRKRKNTRSRARPASSVLETNVDIILEAARVLENEKPPKEVVDSDDESTTSDINLKSLQVKQRNKKLCKKKTSVKSGGSFSDSDEEPLAKLTVKTDPDQNQKKPPRKTADKVLANPATIMEPKPKRECTKRPSYYLPMMSSSDEDEKSYFHGFSNTKKEEVEKPKVFVQATLDLLSKDIGRKGKVNMSNEQIEQWLKDSALAGSSVAKENDAMLKFGEKIPAESLQEKTEKFEEPQAGCSKSSTFEKPQKTDVKSPLSDRKWIFKKDKNNTTPNKNAFSPENECSVYAFGEDNEDTVVSTPFRRPSRRPSSTATSRSEDDFMKNDELSKLGHFRKPNPSDSEDCFNIPQNPAKLIKTGKGAFQDGMVPPSAYHSKRQKQSSAEKFLEPFDDSKYKVPSSPSASSGSSAKLYKKGPPKKPPKAWECASPVYVTDFPKPNEPAKYVEAPVFHPTEQEFQDPLEYIERIRHKAEQFGICKIVPPSGFKPECKVSDDMRFTAYNQYVHKMLHRWGPNFKEFVAIRKYLATQSIFLKTPPLIGGMEIDLPRLYQTVQCLGGLKEVIEKKKWSKVSEHMKIPKSAQDRVTKLDDIYCKYLLPYDTLSHAEREKLFEEVDTFWAKKECQQADQDGFDSDDNDVDECTIKGKSMALNAFYRIARNTMSMYFKVAEPTASEVEQEFWRYVTQKQNHICVHSASIDCGTWGYGFAVSKNSPFAKHPWNLKVLSNNGGSVLRSLGPVMGVTVPTLHVGMVFSACCWYRDPHGLPWVEYLHTGGNKIWYGIPSSSCEVFHDAMKKLVPNYCRDKELWLPSDTAMVPPEMLLERNVSLCRTIQEPGEFMVVFPKVYTSSISTGYVVCESVYFAPLYWLKTARSLFDDLKNSCEPSMFSLDRLFLSIGTDNRSSVEVLRAVLPFIEELCSKEKTNRLQVKEFKIPEEKITSSESKKKIQTVDGDLECEICRTNLYVSMLVDVQEELIYCMDDGIKLLEKDEAKDRFKLRYNLTVEELISFPSKVTALIESKLQKKPPPGKFAGLPTLLK